MKTGIVRVSVFVGQWDDPVQHPCIRFDVPRVRLTNQPLSASNRLNRYWDTQLGAISEHDLGKRGVALRDWIRDEQLISGFLLDSSRLILSLAPTMTGGQTESELRIAQDIESLLSSAKAKLRQVVAGPKGTELRFSDVQYVMVVHDLLAPASNP